MKADFESLLAQARQTCREVKLLEVLLEECADDLPPHMEHGRHAQIDPFRLSGTLGECRYAVRQLLKAESEARAVLREFAAFAEAAPPGEEP